MTELYTASGVPVLKTRVGRSIGRTVYAQVGDLASKDDVLIGVMDTRELADAVVEAMNVMLVAKAATTFIKEADADEAVLVGLQEIPRLIDEQAQVRRRRPFYGQKAALNLAAFSDALEALEERVHTIEKDDPIPNIVVVQDLERMGTQIRKLTARVHDLEHPDQPKTIHHVPSLGEDVRVEPPAGSVVVDEGDIAWTRGAESLWYAVGADEGAIDWEAMRWRGLLTLVHRGADG